ncbi:HAMP domain-containing protein [Planosporangium flavigriseum]|nr:nitrate- and nitrite sensing domain-containing protein [Planosporangium flavigriseum]NJC63500.1 HAMP domain-containing protein [Planosporangium flavigriseum]
MGWLRNAPIWSKLGLIMVVPTIATVVVGMLGLIDNYHRANDADQARLLSGFTAESGALVHELQNERAASTLLLGAPSNDSRAAFERQTAVTTEAYKRYRQRRSALANLPADFRGQLNRIDTQLSDLTKQREQIKSSGQQNVAEPTTLSNAIFRYQTLIGDLVAIRGSAAQLAGDQELGGDMRASAALSQSKEHLAQERVVVLQALLQRSMPVQMKVTFIGTLKGQEQALRQFQSFATPEQRTLYDKTVTGGDRREAETYQSIISGLSTDEFPADIFTPTQWDRAMVGQASLVRRVEVALDEHVVGHAADLRDRLQQRMVLQVGLLLGLLMLSILFAWIVARSMARSLRELRHGALTVAQYGLPQAVARLRDPQLATQASPQQLAAQIAEPLPVRSNDEFGQVAEAFNAVHLEAVRTAAEQAALRASVATMFVNLARRSQILVDRLIGHLDRLERGEEDPDRLAELFQLDHLATRMRRNDENLLVLAGADSTRIQREPAPLMDVLRAAQSEVEHYTRIEFGMIDRDVEMAAHSVNDMVHLIAELLDNATAFSPPDSPVVVEARRVGDRAVLIIEDRGIGISPDQLRELNERLANPPMVDVAVSRMMGLVVVARLAARHGVKVELRPARERGTIADLTLPASVLVPRALAGRGGVPVAGSRELAGADSASGGQERSPYGQPLALESASSAVAPTVPSGDPVSTTGAFPVVGASPWIGADQSAATPGPALNGSASGPFAGPDGQVNSRPFTDSGQGAPGLFGGSWPTSGAPADSGASPTSSAPSTSGAPSTGGDVGPIAMPGRGQPPVWSDLIGGAGEAGVTQPPAWPQEQAPLSHEQTPLPQDRVPLPHRRPTVEPPLSEGPAGGDTGIPRQRPVQAGAQAEDGVPALPEAAVGPSAPTALRPVDAGSSRPVSAAPATPPAWPPVPKQAESEIVTGAEPPQVPTAFSAALDMTAEMPRVRVDWEQNVEQPADGAGHDRRTAAQRFADETMELPIFRELESAWFHKPGATSEPTVPTNGAPTNGAPAEEKPAYESEATPSAAPEPAEAPVEASTSRPAAATEVPEESVAPAVASTEPQPEPAERQAAAESPAWRTAADEGWKAASAIAEQQDFTTTATGLPKRVPMSQLVPGGVEKGTVSAHKRTPEAVRGLLSAYHRGVQRGRSSKSGDAKTPEHTTAGPQSSQGGKEQEA